MNSLASRSIYRAAAHFRNPSIWSEYERLKRSETMSLAELQQIQIERAQQLLAFAEAHSPFYKQRFRQYGLNVKSFSAMEELRALPVLTKAELIGENARIQSQFSFSSLIKAETSGTSGESLKFWRNERWDSTSRAHVMRAYDWYGVKPWDRNGYLWGYDIAPSRARRVRLLDSLQNRFRLFRYDRDAIVKFAERLATARYLSGYSSMIFEIAKSMVECGLSAPHLKLVKGTSETILDVYQAESLRAFGQRIVSEYGAAESGLIAFECPAGSMHINVEDVHLERLDDGSAIVTNLASLSFPIVRYQLGDIIELSGEPCRCGRQHPVLKAVVGRKGGTVVGRANRYPALSFYYVFKNIAIDSSVLLNYRVLQRQPGTCEISIEGHGNARHEHLVRAQLEKYFGGDIAFVFMYVNEFPRGGRKAQYFETMV